MIEVPLWVGWWVESFSEQKGVSFGDLMLWVVESYR